MGTNKRLIDNQELVFSKRVIENQELVFSKFPKMCSLSSI